MPALSRFHSKVKHYCINITLISKQCSSTADVIIIVLRILNHPKEFCFMKWTNLKKLFPPQTHTCVRELVKSEGVHFLVFFILIIAIVIVIGLIKYLVWFMPSKLSIHVSKQNGIDNLVSQSPLFLVKTNSNFRIYLPL